MKFNKNAFAILKAEEKSSLALKNIQNKSSWQAGEILKKSHYKYLEIATRAQKFFEIFNTYYNLYDTLIPDNIHINQDFKKYIELCIEQRLKISDVVKQIDNEAYERSGTREPLIIEGILALKKSKSIHEQNLYNVIMEFDRYNNFRILPAKVQEPSGFKRRNKKRFKKHLLISVTLEPYTLHRIKEIFTQNSKKLENEGYVAITNYPDTSEIIRVNANEDILKRFSKMSLYVFKQKDKAQDYIDIVFEYLSQEQKTPQKGLKFWPNFRNLIKESLNYNDLNNISPTRKSLHEAIFDMDHYYKNKKNQSDYRKSFK